jgi:transposase
MFPMQRKYTSEYRQEAIRLAKVGDRSMTEVAKELGIPLQTLSRWFRQAKIDEGSGEHGELTTAERQELSQLRREVARLREEKEILKKATAFFARESK